MHVAATLLMRGERIVRKLLNHLEVLTAFFARYSYRGIVQVFLELALGLLRILLNDWMLLVDDGPVRFVHQLRNGRFSRNQIDRLLQQIIFGILRRGAGNRISVLIQFGRVIVFGKLNGRDNSGVLNSFPGGRIVLRDRENERAAIFHLNGFSNACVAVAAFAHHLRPFVVFEQRPRLRFPRLPPLRGP